MGSWTDLFDLHNLISLLEALLEIDLYGRLVDDVLQDLIDVSLSVDEDCLHLAVSTPSLEPNEPLPVMVFIYGGGFKVCIANKELLWQFSQIILINILLIS